MTGVLHPVAAGDPAAPVPWDSLWVTDNLSPLFGSADWALAESDEPLNRGGLTALDRLGTAIVLCLFLDKRRPDDVDSPNGTNDRRGWPGDSFDIDADAGEREIGSLLWTLDRSALDDHTVRLAKHYASEALQTLIDQGAVSRFDIEAAADHANGMLVLSIDAIDETGQPIFSKAFPLF